MNFASYLSPHLSIGKDRPPNSSDTASVGSHRSSLSNKSKNSQDYQVLLQELRNNAEVFHRARSAFASSLLKMGEFHCRNGEYDEALLALNEGLSENRISACNSLSSLPSLEIAETGDESLVSGLTASQSFHGGLNIPRAFGSSSWTVSSQTSSPSYLSAVQSKKKDDNIKSPQGSKSAESEEAIKSLNDLAQTLSSLGKVHSLRGEDETAVKYYNEKTKVQALRIKYIEEQSVGNAGCQGIGGVFGGTILEEINDDVKALDELFRGFGFSLKEKKEEKSENRDDCEDNRSASQHSCSSSSSRKSSKKSRSETARSNVEVPTNDSEGNTSPSKIRCLSISPQPPLPPIRQTRLETFSDSNSRGNVVQEDSELVDAIDSYRTTIDSFGERNSERHERKYAEYVRKYESLKSSASSRGGSTVSSGNHSALAPDLQLQRREWKVALDVYESALTAQDEVVSRTNFGPGTPRKRTASEYGQEAQLNVASLLIAQGGLYYKLNHVQKELSKYREALKVYQDTLGRDHPHVAGTMKNIGMVMAEMGHYDEATLMFKDAEMIYRSFDHTTHEVAGVLSCMGNVHNRQGDFDGALKFYGDALAMYKLLSKRSRDAGHSAHLALQETASTLKVMGMVHTKLGTLDEAMICFQEAIDIMRFNFDEMGSGPIVFSILSRIGGIFSKMNKLDEAMSHYHESYDVAARVFGTTDHPELAKILHHIGGIHQRENDWQEAMRCYKTAARILQATLGKDDPAIATTLVCIGNLHYLSNNLDQAMNYYNEALRINRLAYGTKHADVIPTMKSIAIIHVKKGSFDEAIGVFTQVLQIKLSEVGRSHPEVASAHKRLGNVYWQKGEKAAAEIHYSKALHIYSSCLGDDHEATRGVRAIVDKVVKELDDSASTRQQTETNAEADARIPSTSFFKRAPKGYESL